MRTRILSVGSAAATVSKAYARRHNAAAVVVGVVAYDLAAPGGGKNAGCRQKKREKASAMPLYRLHADGISAYSARESFVLFGAADKVGKVGFHMLLR